MFSSNIRKVTTFVDTNKTQKIFTKSKAVLASSANVSEGNVRSFEEIPSPPGLPFVGHLQMFFKKENAEDLTKFVKNLQAEYGSIVRYDCPYNVFFKIIKYLIKIKSTWNG